MRAADGHGASKLASAWRFTSWRRCIASAESSRRPRTRIARERARKICPNRDARCLRLAEGQIERGRRRRFDVRATKHAIGRTRAPRSRREPSRCFIAAGDVAAARAAADETVGDCRGSSMRRSSRAYARQASGAVLLAESNPHAALDPLREAMSLWRELDVPYETARVGVLHRSRLSRARRSRQRCTLEFEAARRVFEQLGARPDCASSQRVSARPEKDAGGG